MFKFGSRLLAVGASLLAMAQAQTEEEIERYKKMTILSVGVAAPIQVEPYQDFRGGGVRSFAVPFYVYNKNNLTLAGPNVSYRFWKPLGVQLSAEGRYRFQNFEANDSPVLEGMDDRNGTFEVGLRAGRRFDRLRIRAEGMADVFGQHRGYEMQAFANFEVGNGRMISFRPEAGVLYQNRDVVNYYYGVKDREALFLDASGDPLVLGPGADGGPLTVDDFERTGIREDGSLIRPAYQSDGAVVPFVGATARIRLSRRIQFNAQVRSRFLPDEITNSPIVDQNHRTTAFIGLSYGLSGPGIKKGEWL